MEQQAERFNRSMELQQAAMQSQTEQTKALVSGLKDILKDCLKSDSKMLRALPINLKIYMFCCWIVE